MKISTGDRDSWLWLLRLSISIAVMFAWLVFSHSNMGEGWDFALHDWMLQRRGELTAPDDVVVVALDEATYDAWQLPQNQIIPRERWAKVVRKLAELGASRVVFDVLFQGRGAVPAWDDELRESFKSLPTFLAVDHDLIQYNDGTERYEVLKPDPYIAEHSAGLGLVDHETEGAVQRYFRTAPLFNRSQYLSLSEVGAGIENLGGRQGHGMPNQWDMVQYYGRAHSIPTFSLYTILEEEFPFPAEYVRNKIVFVGLSLRTGFGVESKDEYMTPWGPIFGVEIHATKAANMLAREWIRRPPRGSEDRMLGALLFFCSLLVLTSKPIVSFGMTLVMIVGWFTAAYTMLTVNYYLGGGSAVTLFLPATCLGTTLTWYLQARRQQLWIERAFAHYLSPTMVDQLKADPTALKLGGEEVVATAMFTDIQGFTAISEQLGATGTTKMLNAYFSVVSRVILEEGGTLIKFIGDAVFALWNAPLRQADHADRAVRAALRIQECCAEFNDRGEFPPIVTRVGINSGKMVVGNLGSESRVDYTAVGDPVNLASRVEGANKYIGCKVLVTEATLSLGVEGVNPLLMGAFKVVGKAQPVKLYQIGVTDVSQTERRRWEEALRWFCERRFDDVRGRFEEFRISGSRLAQPASLYLSFIDSVDTNELDPSWNGELVLDQK